MTFEEAFNWLSGFQFHGIKPGLERIRELLRRLGHPERVFPSVLIAGTNGKGSTAAILESVLRHHGLKTGLYTSPHLVSLNERFVVSGRQITPSRLASLCNKVREALAELPATYFELTTAIAFLYFAEEKVEIAVVECGLGGRLDATNVLQPLVSIITNVGLDHQAYLGESLPEIAFEKAGILRPETPAIVGRVPEEAFEVIKDRAQILNAPLYRLGRDFRVFPCRGGFFYQGEQQFPRLELSLCGKFQMENLALALKAAEIISQKGLFSLEDPKLREALRQVYWPGRYEKIKTHQRLVILDGAHNPQGVQALLKTLHQEGIESYDLLFAASNEGGKKPYLEMLLTLLPKAQKVYLCEPPGPRNPVKIEDWQRALEALNLHGTVIEFHDTWEKALSRALEEPAPPLLVTGSLYLVGQIRKKLAPGVRL